MPNGTPHPPESSVARFARFRDQLDAILDAELGPCGRVGVLDAPYDANVGNHMMWLAIVDYLQRRKIEIVYTSHARAFDAKTMIDALAGAPILFLGGVTVSRLWPHHADIKRRVARLCRANRLISLPATVLFADAEDQREAGDLFEGHPDVTLLVRDPISAEQANAAFSRGVRVITAPDLSFRLDPQPRATAPTYDILWLARDDLEGIRYEPPPEAHVFDWTHHLRQDVPAIWAPLRTARALDKFRSRLTRRTAQPVNRAVAWLSEHASNSALAYGNRVLDTGKVLVTDRLHPHVLAALRRQPVVLLPDQFGKNRAVYQYYTNNVEHVHWAETPDEARDLARSLAALVSL